MEEFIAVSRDRESFLGSIVLHGYLFGVDSDGPWIYPSLKRPKDGSKILIRRAYGTLPYWRTETVSILTSSAAKRIVSHFSNEERAPKKSAREITSRINPPKLINKEKIKMGLKQTLQYNSIKTVECSDISIANNSKPFKKCMFSHCSEPAFGSTEYCWEHYKQERYTLR